MGFDSGFQMGMRLMQEDAQQRQQDKENAWREEQVQAWREQKERDAKLREGVEGVRKATLSQIDADSKEQMFAPGGTLQYPTQPPGAAGGYAPAPIPGEAPQQRPLGDAAGPPEMRRTALQLPQGYAEQLNMNRALATAAPNLESLANLQAHQQKLKYFSQGRALGDYVRSAKEDELDTFMQDINDSKRNGFSATKGKNGYYTIESDSVKPIKMNREQLADWLSSQHVYKNTGDESALGRINSISENLAAQVKDSFSRAKGVAELGNQGTHYANADANAGARLGLARSQANRPEMMELIDKRTGEPVMFDARKMQFSKDGQAVLPTGLAYPTKARQSSEFGTKMPGSDEYRRMADGTVVQYQEGAPVAVNGVPPSMRASTAEKLGFEPDQVAAVNAVNPRTFEWAPLGDGFVFRGQKYLLSDPDDMKILKDEMRKTTVANRRVIDGGRDNGASVQRPGGQDRFAQPAPYPLPLPPRNR